VKIAYLDPPYSRYFHALAADLTAAASDSVVALLSSPAYRLYTADDRTVVWTPGVSDAVHPVPAEYLRSGWIAGRGRSLAVFAHAVEWFKARFVEEKIELCLVFSDVRPFSVAAQVAACELGVICLYFERGAFRFATASLSAQGLNSRFSLRRGLSGGTAPAEWFAETELQRRPVEPWLRTRFAWFMARNALACLLRPDRSRIQHKRYALAPYVRLALAQWWSAHHNAANDDKALALTDGRPVVVVPLQLASDSQFVLHSPFSGVQAFIDFVGAQVKAVCPEAELVFKRHPMDTMPYRLTAGAQWFGGNLARLYEREPIVVCINSTVGFDALVHGVRVICFGSSFYAEAATLTMATPDSFMAQFRRVLGMRGDAAAGRELRTAVLRSYQAPGDVWSFTSHDIQRTAALVRMHCQEARAAEAAAATAALRLDASDLASVSADAGAAGPADRLAALPAPSSTVPKALARQW
jgi:capsular polysaccharide export protein